jgi:hypothetical protein
LFCALRKMSPSIPLLAPSTRSVSR